MNMNKTSCQKYVFEQNEYNSSPILELSVKFASQIHHENINKTLDGAYLADFGIDIKQRERGEARRRQLASTLSYLLTTSKTNLLFGMIGNLPPRGIVFNRPATLDSLD